jgi:hypothetical protein
VKLLGGVLKARSVRGRGDLRHMHVYKTVPDLPFPLHPLTRTVKWPIRVRDAAVIA